MATRTIANGGGNYNATGTWVEGVVPGASDDVVATATSGQLTVSAAAAARSADFTGYVSTLTITSGQTWSVGTSTAGAFKMVSGMAVAGTGVLKFVSTTTGNNITWATRNPGWTVNFNGSAGSWTLQDAFTITGASNLIVGTLNTNGQAWTSSTFAMGGVGSNTLTLGATLMTLTSTGTPWSYTSTGPSTLNANTSTISLTGTGATFAGGGATYNTVSATALTGTLVITGANTFAHLTLASTAAATTTFVASTTNTINGLKLNGVSGGQLTLKSATAATVTTLALGAGAVQIPITFCTFKDATVTGGPIDATRGGVDSGNNTGIIFPQTFTYSASGAYLWTAPVGVTAVKLQCWGAGGGGGCYGGSDIGSAGGGGGGGFSQKNSLSVTPGTTYTVTVGKSGAGGVASGGVGQDGGLGGDSWFSTSGTVLAKGGAGGLGSKNATFDGGAGGASGSGIGDTKTSGGVGGTPNTSTIAGGGGGGSGGDTTNGGAGGNTTGATAGTAGTAGTTNGAAGGAGGHGVSSTTVGSPGVAPGGAGGGGGSDNTTTRNGGAGADGQVVITVNGLIGHDVTDMENSPGATGWQAPNRAGTY